MAVWGILPAEPVVLPAEEFFLWPENVAAWSLWHSIQTQWRTNAGGERDGLDYTGVEVEIRMHRRWRRDLRSRWQEIKVMERAALRAWAEKARRKG